MKEVKAFINSESFNVKDMGESEGIIYISGIASTMIDPNGKTFKDRDTEIVSLLDGVTIDTNHKGTMPLFVNHSYTLEDTAGIVTKMYLNSKGQLAYEGEVHSAINPKAAYMIRKGLLTNVSIGFSANSWDIEEDNDGMYGVLSDISVYELSLTNLPANKFATLEITGEKSLKIKQPVNELQKANPDCDGLECKLKSLKEKKENQMTNKQELEIKNILAKALTFDETEMESWNQYDLIWHYIDILRQTIGDNWGELMWGDSLSGDEVRDNVLSSIESFSQKVSELFDNHIENVNKSLGVDHEIKGKKMVIKNTETEPKEEQPVDTEETPTEEVQEEPTTETESKTEETKEEPPVEEPKKEEPKEDKPVEEKPTEQAPKEEPKKEEAVPEKEPEPVSAIQELVGKLSVIDINDMEDSNEIDALLTQIFRINDAAEEIADKLAELESENKN